MFSTNKESDVDKLNKFRELIEESNKSLGIEEPVIKLSEDQNKALNLFKEGHNLLIIGAGGNGKSMLIKELCYYNNKQVFNKKLVLTATTGISAFSINGITINSFMGIGTGDLPIEVLLKKIHKKQYIKDRILSTEILIIDEISMMSLAIFEKINIICQQIRKDKSFFGGIQIILVGDFLQLLPVFNLKINPSQDTRLIFESPIFNKYFTKNNIINLKYNFRQESDSTYKDILNRMRVKSNLPTDFTTLDTRLDKNINDENIVHIVVSNKKANDINTFYMNKIKNPSKTFQAKYQLTKNELEVELLKELQYQFKQKNIDDITLKIGARVMLIKNLNTDTGLYNGATGIITQFINGFPLVKFDNGITSIINGENFELEIDNVRITATQIPLIICYAITVHKSQSQTINKAIIDIADAFCDSMVYVALSRVSNLDGLFLKTFNQNKITINEKVLNYLKKIKCY